jgi:flagellar motor protein MotB
MRLLAITFDGYASGQTDFVTLLGAGPQPGFADLDDVMTIIAGQITTPVPNLHVSLIVVGHSDRQDRADLGCDQRRASEIEAARDRAVSAWDFIKTAVNAKVTAAGGTAGEWWETSPHVKWGLVFAAAGMLVHDPPADAERALNRRVVVLVSLFNPE